MTVKELKAELDFYEDDMDVIFEVDDDFEPETITESKYGWREVRIREKLIPSFISEISGDVRIELGKMG